MVTKKVRIGIASHGQLKNRATAIARGQRRRTPREPMIWFTSIESFARILSGPNRELLRIIDEKRPASLKELEILTGRKVSNLSRTLKTMHRYGLVSLEQGKRGALTPKVLVRELHMELALIG